jgi:hypothetical protein
VAWLAQRSDQTGPVEVYLDGVDQGTVTPTTSAAPYPSQQVGYSITGLIPGEHTLKIVNNAANLLTVDAFTVERTRQVTNDSALTYTGAGWKHLTRRAGDFGNDVHWTNAAGASALFAFNGTTASWIAESTGTSGPVQIYVDGINEATLTPRASSAPRPLHQVDYQVSGLAAGYHVIKIVNASAAPLTVDAFTSRY